MTRIERIKSMTAGELSEWFRLNLPCTGTRCPAHQKCLTVPADGCHKAWKKWLEEKEEEDK